MPQKCLRLKVQRNEHMIKFSNESILPIINIKQSLKIKEKNYLLNIIFRWQTLQNSFKTFQLISQVHQKLNQYNFVSHIIR